MKSIRDKLYLSTIADDDYEQAAAYGVGLEIAEFCAAMNMDGELFPIFDSNVRIKMKSAGRFVFHGPFAELSPCSIDPKVRQVSMERYLQAARLAAQYGARRVVLHSGFIPQVYFPHWYEEESIKFWRELLPQLPEGTEIVLENVMDPAPDSMVRDVRKVADPGYRARQLRPGRGDARPMARSVSALPAPCPSAQQRWQVGPAQPPERGHDPDGRDAGLAERERPRCDDDD